MSVPHVRSKLWALAALAGLLVSLGSGWAAWRLRKDLIVQVRHGQRQKAISLVPLSETALKDKDFGGASRYRTLAKNFLKENVAEAVGIARYDGKQLFSTTFNAETPLPDLSKTRLHAKALLTGGGEDQVHRSRDVAGIAHVIYIQPLREGATFGAYLHVDFDPAKSERPVIDGMARMRLLRGGFVLGFLFFLFAGYKTARATQAETGERPRLV